VFPAVARHVCSADNVAAHDVRLPRSVSLHFAIAKVNLPSAFAIAPFKSALRQSVVEILPLSS